MEQEKTIKKDKKKKLKLRFKIIILMILIVAYAFLIGPRGIFTKDLLIKSDKINMDLNGVKIMQFSDLHYGSNIKKSEIKKLVKKINLSNPDIVIFTGDLIDKRYNVTANDIQFLKKELSSIKAEYGKYYVKGEEDFDDATSILNISDFTDLSKGQQLVYFNKTPILLIDKDNSKAYFENNDGSLEYKVLVMHNPDDINDILNYNFELAIAGHTHNGQINIPKLKDLLIKSKYKKTYQKVNNTKLYINPGIGNSFLNVRLFNHPTIYLYRLKNTTTS